MAEMGTDTRLIVYLEGKPPPLAEETGQDKTDAS